MFQQIMKDMAKEATFIEGMTLSLHFFVSS